ncbi:MAG: PAS domain S-box protein [Pseudomonadota bacterium]
MAEPSRTYQELLEENAILKQKIQALGALGVSDDSTGRMVSKEALRKSEEMYRSLYEGSREGIVQIDMEGRFVAFNPSYLEMLGYTAEELLGKSYKVITPPGIEEWEDRIVREQIQGRGYSDVYEKEYIRKDGTIVPVELRAFLINIGGQSVGMWGVCRDITDRKLSELALREANHFHEQIIFCAQEGVIVLGSEKRCLFWNPFMEQLTGMPAADVLGKHLLEIFPHLRDSPIIEKLNAALSGKTSDFSERPYHVPGTGKSGWITERVSPLRSLEGEIIGVIVALRDITERKLVEQELQASEERYRTIFEVSNEGILVAEIESLHFRYANPAVCSMFGYTFQEFLLKRVFDVHPKEALEEVKKYFLEFTEGLKTHINAMPCMRKDGSVIYMDIAGAHFTFDGKECMLGFFTDITERRIAELRLQESEQKYRSLFERTADAILIYETDTYSIVDVNTSAEELYGYSREEFSKLKAYELSTESEETLAKLKKASAGITVFIPLRYHRRKDGTVFPCEIRTGTFELGGQRLVFGLIQDITGRKMAEEKLLASLREKEVLLKELHHRTKNNMQVISSLLSLQLKYIDGENESLTTIFSDIQSRIKSMALVHEMLYMSRDIASIDLRDYVQALVASLLPGSMAAAKKISLALDLESVIVGIEAAIPFGLAANELLTNVIKHAFPGGRAGSVTISLHAREGNEIHLAIKDDGVGMPQNFFSGKGATLGLILVRNLVEYQLQGRLELDSGTGTQFKIIFAYFLSKGMAADG